MFRRFKAKAVEEGLRLGEALTQAMELWIEERSRGGAELAFRV